MKALCFSLAMAAVLLLSSCRGSDIWNGAQIVYTGEEIRYNEMSTFQWYLTRAISPGSLNEGIQVAALMPSCGCLTLTNLSSSAVTLDATFHGERLGTVALGPDPSQVPSADPTGYQRTIKVDWGGSGRNDVYMLELYAEDNTTRLPQIRGIIDVGFVAGSCRNVACEVGALAMNRGERVIGASGIDARFHGAEFIENGQILRVASAVNTCGCMTVTNITGTGASIDQTEQGLTRTEMSEEERQRLRDRIASGTVSEESSPLEAQAVTLRAMKHGTVVGEMTLEPGMTERFKYDWAGSGDADLYIVEVFGGQDNHLRAMDAIRLDGYTDEVNCNAVSCEISTLNLNQAEVAAPAQTGPPTSRR